MPEASKRWRFAARLAIGVVFTHAAHAEPLEADSLSVLIGQYLSAPDDDAAKQHFDDISQLESLSSAQVAGMLRGYSEAGASLPSWNKAETRQGTFQAAGMTIRYDLPASHNPKVALPVVVVVSQSGVEADALAEYRLKLGSKADDAVIMCSGAGSSPAGRGGWIPDALADLSRRFRLDRDRVYGLLDGEHSTRTWWTVLGAVDEFASVICVTSFPRIDYPVEHLPLLVRNLEGMPMLIGWDHGVEGWDSHARLLRQVARKSGVSVALVTSAPGHSIWTTAPFQGQVSGMLTVRRGPRRLSFDRRFSRFGGTSGWIRGITFRDFPETNEQLSIVAGASTDRGEFVRDVLDGFLGQLSVSLDGTEVSITTRKCAALVIDWPLEMTDRKSSVKAVTCNGRLRRIEPPISDWRIMLRRARESMDFRRLTGARTEIRVHTDG